MIVLVRVFLVRMLMAVMAAPVELKELIDQWDSKFANFCFVHICPRSACSTSWTGSSTFRSQDVISDIAIEAENSDGLGGRKEEC